MTKAVVLISGGIDSTVALWWAMSRGWQPIPLTFDYYARPEAEKAATRSILRKAGIRRFIEVPLRFVREVEDLGGDVSGRGRLRGAPDGYIPARNMIFYSVAAYYAEVRDAEFIVGGHNLADPEEFPDSARDFFKQLNALLKIGLWSYKRGPAKILTPLKDKSKRDVVRLGLRLGAPLDLTWSCHRDGRKPCGRCSSCVERNLAFSSAGLDRPRHGR
jgi:7-cyano-7-deazaguanine synthase